MNRHKDESSGSSDDSVKVKKKHKKDKHIEKKHKKKKRKHRTSDSESEKEKRSHRKHKKIKRKKNSKEEKDDSEVNEAIPGPSVPADLVPENSKARAPMTKEEWEKSQSIVRRVYDDSGRSRWESVKIRSTIFLFQHNYFLKIFSTD